MNRSTKSQSSLDNKEDANLMSNKSDSLTWNLLAEGIPRFGRVARFDNRVYNVIQTSTQTTLYTTSTTIPTFGSKYFSTADFPQFSSWASVFDQYKFVEVEVWITPATPVQTLVGTAYFYSVIDYDDANNLSSIPAVVQYTNLVCSPHTNGHYRKFTPHIAGAVYSGAFTSFANRRPEWIDVASPNVQHYGLKCASDSTSTTVPIQVMTRIWIQFRNVF